MKWFKHDADANADAKLQNVLLDYGLEGYGLYWYCVELIAGKVDVDNLTFQLEHDARIIARNTGSTTQKVEEMMKYFVKLGLFECSDNVISCLKMARRLDKSMTSNSKMRELIEKIKLENHDGVMTIPDSVMQEEKRIDNNNMSFSNDENCNSTAKKSKFSYDKERIKSTWNGKASGLGLPTIRSVTDTVEKGLVRLYKSYLKMCKEVGKEPNDMDTVINGYIEHGYQPTKWALGENPEGKKYGIATALTQQKIDEILGG